MDGKLFGKLCNNIWGYLERLMDIIIDMVLIEGFGLVI